MKVPIIRIEDWDEDPPLATRYVHGENDLDLSSTYTKAKSLYDHPGRGRHIMVRLSESEGQGQGLIVRECSPDFMQDFWITAARLLDYFADFLSTDTPAMQSVWFHLLDLVQEAAHLPHDFWREGRVPLCSHAQRFLRDYEQYVHLVNIVIMSKKFRAMDAMAYPSINMWCTNDENAGAFRAGLKPWMQFLCSGSPGFGVKEAERQYMWAGRLRARAGRANIRGELSEQFVPMGGLAIILQHMERQRRLVTQFASTHTNRYDEAAILHEFGKNCFPFDRPFAYISLGGHETLIQPMYPRRSARHAPYKEPTFSDPAMMEDEPDFNLLDESLGYLKGVEPFEHPYDNNNEFHMWHIISGKRDREEGADKSIKRLNKTKRVNRDEFFRVFEPRFE